MGRQTNHDEKKDARAKRRVRVPARFQLPQEETINYKNVSVLQKFLNERGKIIPRRVTGLSAHAQRKLTVAIKRARFLALLPSGAAR